MAANMPAIINLQGLLSSQIPVRDGFTHRHHLLPRIGRPPLIFRFCFFDCIMVSHSNHEKSAQSLYSHRIERIFVVHRNQLSWSLINSVHDAAGFAHNTPLDN